MVNYLNFNWLNPIACCWFHPFQCVICIYFLDPLSSHESLVYIQNFMAYHGMTIFFCHISASSSARGLTQRRNSYRCSPTTRSASWSGRRASGRAGRWRSTAVSRASCSWSSWMRRRKMGCQRWEKRMLNLGSVMADIQWYWYLYVFVIDVIIFLDIYIYGYMNMLIMCYCMFGSSRCIYIYIYSSQK